MSEQFQMKDFCFPPGVYKTKLKTFFPSFFISARLGLKLGEKKKQLHLYFAMFGRKFQLEIELRLIALTSCHSVIVIWVLEAKQSENGIYIKFLKKLDSVSSHSHEPDT